MIDGDLFLTNKERLQPLVAKCDEQLAAGRDFIVLALSHREPPQGETTMLFGYCGTRGEVLNYVRGTTGTITARFKASKVRAALIDKIHQELLNG